MTKRKALIALLMSAAPILGGAQAQGLRVQQHLSGYICMGLNLSEDQLRNFSSLPSIYSAPSASAARIGVASATVMVKTPPQVTNGFEAVLHLNGTPGWIKADLLVPWRNASNPQIRCIPSMMSNGHPGFDYTRPG